MISRWGDIEQDIVGKLTATVGTPILPATKPLVRHVAANTSEDAADEAPKDYPAVIVVFAGARLTKPDYTQTGRKFLSSAEGRYRAIGYGTTGKADEKARYGTSGLYAVMEAVRTALHGFTPPSITDGQWFLLWQDESPAVGYEKKNGTGGLKMTQEYSLMQTIPGTVT